MVYKDFCKTNIAFMNKKELASYCLSLDYTKIALVMSESAAKRYDLELLVSELEQKCRVVWIKESVTYPTQEILLAGIAKLKDFGAEAILAIGGGSAIDFAKAMKAFAGVRDVNSIDVVTEYLSKKRVFTKDSTVDIIAVPTTAGTGAEVTQWATIWDYQRRCKYSIDMDILKPDMAIIVPDLAAVADRALTITTGLDSMAHAMEAYWSRKTSSLVRQLARNSIELTLQYLEKVLNEPENLVWREKQCLASVLSGLAFSMTRTTASHSISYPLTMHYNISHGIAVAMTLAQVAEYNSGMFPEEEELLALFQKYGGIRNYLEKICGNTVSLRLHGYGIEEADLKDIAEASFTLGRMDNNPREMSKEIVEEILRSTL